MGRGTGVHKVGLTASLLGFLSLLALPFASVAGSRIQSGVPKRLFQATGAPLSALVIGTFVLMALLSMTRSRSRGFAFARGASAGLAIVAILWVSGLVATDLGAKTGQFARVSIGTGAWGAILAAAMLVVASRGELRDSPLLAALVGALPLVAVVALALSGALVDTGLAKEYHNNRDRFWKESGAQLTLALSALGIATVIGSALALLAFRVPRTRKPVFGVVNLFQTVPGLALLGMLVAPLAVISRRYPYLRSIGVRGIGWFPVIIVLIMYALLPIVRNVYTGLRNVPGSVVDAGRGMGMTESQLMARVRLPLALPVFFSGLRTADVQAIGNATIGAFAAAGTLGVFIFQGLAQQAFDLVLLGSLTLVALSLLTEGVLIAIQRALARRYGTVVGADGEGAIP